MDNILEKWRSNIWVIATSAGILACLIGVAYTFYLMQDEAGAEGEYRVTADEMRLLSQQVTTTVRETAAGRGTTFAELEQQLGKFDLQLKEIEAVGLDRELELIRDRWQPVRAAAKTLVAAGPRIAFINGVSKQLEKNVRPIQSQFSAVVDILRDEKVSSETIVAAQKTLWLSERIARNIDKILAGGEASQNAADEFRSDAADFSRITQALGEGNRLMGVDRVTDVHALDAMRTATQLFSVVSTSIDQIGTASVELQQAAGARNTILESSAALTDSISALIPALDRLSVERRYNRGTLMALFGAPALLAVGLLIFMYRGQRQRVEYTEQGVAEINNALVRIAEGDLTVQVPENNTVTAEIAREINISTERQRELIRNIRTPFEMSVEEINKIGVTARGQVEKGKALTHSVVDSTTAAAETVRTSEEIKTATAEASKTSARNSEQVAQGYELTKEMSKASADVRESVQETSKSAKRQGELIQSVTAAAEYIQALNTKISVVAINTRIEAEKAGEHGRPFLGIAEAIGDLLREAEEEGRKIISEVRMLQNMSAENLASMENTVGTVVTILEFIDRLDSSLEEINAGSSAISSIISTVDSAAANSASNAKHMSQSMAEITERNVDISEYSESTQVGVSSLQRTMREVAQNLSQFRIETAQEFHPPGAAAANRPSKITTAVEAFDRNNAKAAEVGKENLASG